jgi:hypothetical protein
VVQQNGTLFEVDVFTSAAGYNDRMIALGKEPGIDTLRIVTIDAGEFRAEQSAEDVSHRSIFELRLHLHLWQ